ncbi:PEP-CTERM sorting domain-containing protein [Hyphococcus luteus]|uniref:PEP-CTERM protein-sorting domain-containing protein n=1 Tax=Hyphococcus luteus TaxID=2058213 RepID=A0A2S7JZD6_9PROT|nr:PEP-CTERM sorting domain-containing protein [Marinicaulis flavus]PQA85576.1 hypothetical protein CW354_21805 [Marinicaulis flavus]
MKHSLILFAALAAFAAAPAQAGVLYTFAYTGEIAELGLDDGLFGAPGDTEIGDTFSGSFSYVVGPENPDMQPGDATVGQYAIQSAGVDGTLLPLGPVPVFGGIVTHEPGGVALPPAPPDDGEDSLVIPLGFDLGDYATVSLRFEAPYEMAFTDDSLPASLDLSDFVIAEIVGKEAPALSVSLAQNLNDDVETLVDRGVITSLTLISTTPVGEVPLPAALPLFLAGVGVVGAAARRKRRA